MHTYLEEQRMMKNHRQILYSRSPVIVRWRKERESERERRRESEMGRGRERERE